VSGPKTILEAPQQSPGPVGVAGETHWVAERDRWSRTRRAHEQRLFTRFAVDRSPAARDAIVEQFMPLARKLAGRYRNVEDIEDLEQIAAIGLVKAIERFDPGRGIAFTSYAFPTILGELKRYLRDHGWSVRPPRDVQELAARIDKHTITLQSELGRSPTATELAQRTESTVEQVLEAMQSGTARYAVSLDLPAHDADDPDSRGLEIATDEIGFAGAENAVLLDRLLRELTPREQQVVHLRFREDRTQSEIGEIVGISQMHVSRMLRTALERLQAATLGHGSEQ
jgi:RNA polymerase sigma-B factor